MMPTVLNIYRLSILIALWTIPLSAWATLQITEILPDPSGDDESEWIEILNAGEIDASSEGWKITVKGRTTALPIKIIAAGKYIIFTKAEAKFALTNTGADVSLIDPSGNTYSKVIYSKAPVGQSFILVNGSWQWTKTPTPTTANILSTTTNTPATLTTNLNTSTALAKVVDLKSGTKITVEGIVVAKPEELGIKTVFINGLQLNLTSGLWPKLERGDLIHINGSVSHTKTYGTRLNVSSADSIKILNKELIPEPEALKLKYITTKHEGLLIKVSGKISNKGNNWFDLEDEAGRLRITLRNQALGWPKLSNEQVEVTGLITLNQNELRLWPRSPDDINVIKNLETNNSPEIIDLTEKDKTDWRGYAVLFLLGILLVAGWLWENGKLTKFAKKLKNIFGN